MLVISCGRSDGAGSAPYPPPPTPGINVTGAATAQDAPYPAPTATIALAVTSSGYFVPAPVLGVVVDKDIRVVYVEADSAAEQAGIQSGDVLEMIDDTPIASDVKKAKDIIHHAEANQKLRLTLTRAGKMITVEVIPTPPHSRPRPGQPVATTTPVLPPQDYL